MSVPLALSRVLEISELGGAHAIFRAVKFFHLSVMLNNMLIRTDRTVAYSYINHQRSTRSKSLNQNATQLGLWAKNLMGITAVHVRGLENLTADTLIRNFPSSPELTMSRLTFWRVCRHFVTLVVDLFASRTNTQLCRYCSRFPEQEAWGIDALVTKWQSHLLYTFLPPFHQSRELSKSSCWRGEN